MASMAETPKRRWLTPALVASGLIAAGGVVFGLFRARGGKSELFPATKSGEGSLRHAGPAAMRSSAPQDWTKEDQASDESFPASDPPSGYAGPPN